MSQITTHILDTTKGKPAVGVSIILYQHLHGEWVELAKGITNQDGRIPDLLDKKTVLATGIYRMHFETKPYFEQTQTATFYPYVDIVFSITSQEHYHIPLLLNPFGYSTYRGS